MVDTSNMQRGIYGLMKEAIDCVKEEADCIFDGYNTRKEDVDGHALFVSCRDGETG